ncbi:Aly/REF export factor 2 [Frankliniella fusca]|uniref:Aly/REF export factor 2 n=1 Tax=Frankliniella fusca TaxID=407009 RepID=A0AAE1L6G7_9NEOP|nr:Aly/REF export factor 2 [Frankliniella fusca]
MADKIDMSLDEIIKKNKPARGTGARRGRGGGGGAQRNSNSSFPRRGGSSQRNTGRVQQGGIVRRRPAGAPMAMPKYARGDVNSRWTHDMFTGGRPISRTGGIVSGGGPTKLLVSNLDYGVSDSDIKELFAEFGPLKSAAVHYDRSGRSLGTADVIFERRSDAVKAVKQYNGVPLDGRPMDIALATNDVATAIPRSSQRTSGGNSNFAQNRPQNRVGGGNFRNARGGRGTRGAGRGGRGGGRSAKSVPTAEELDAELDAYVSKVQK